VSGYPKTNTAYIIPAFEIFHEMQAYLRKPVQLSTAEKRSFLRRRFESAQIPKSTPPTSSGPEYNRKDKPPRTAYVEDIDESGKPVRGSRRSASIKGGKSLLRTKRSDNAIKLNSDLTQSNESTRQNDREAEKASKEKEKRKSPQALSSRPLNRDRDLKSPTSPRPGDSRTGDNSRSGIPPSIAPEALSFRPRAAVSQAYPRPESYRRPYAPGSHISGPPVSASAFSQPPLITPYYPLPYLSSHARYGVTPQNQWPGYAPRPPFPTRFDPVPRPSSAHSARHIPTYANYPHGYDTRYNDGYATLTGREPIVPAATPPPPRPGIPRRRDTETSRDLQRVQIDVESNKGLRRSYYGKSREYEDMDKFDTAASYQEDISGPRIPLTAEALRRQQQLEESGNNKSTRKIGRQIDSKRTSTTRATTRSVADDEEDVTIKFTGGELQIKRQKSIRGGNESSKYDRSTRRHLQIRRHTVRSRQDTPPGPVGGRSGEQTSSTLPPEESNLGTDSNIHAEIEPLETEKPKGISEVWDNIVVPPSIQASQSSLVGNMDQVQELQSLLDDIKTLLFEAKENDLLRGKSAELWKEAEEIIMLVGWDEGPPDPRSVLLDKEVLESEDDDSGHGTDDDLATQFSDTLGVPAAGEDIPTKGYPATSTPVLLNTTSQAPEKVLADVTSLQDLLYRVQHIHYLLRIETEDSIILKPNPQRGRHEYNHQYGEG
jgi:hypothetical protein